ncbi:hypothetical protein [Thalassospira sp.]|uniref:hypothetical protein n=1 Tax=Thalassospira sp. TaxID=1912094 RepID=UPI002732F2E9|nr:hypothetical protein [Thalassospira sp.]MDP2698615.1 hypothetical protein [Thalassospira sp.]
MNRVIQQQLIDGLVREGLQKPGYSSVVLDFSGIPATRSRIVFQAFIRFLEERSLTNRSLQARRLGGHTVSLVFANDQCDRMLALVEQINYFLMSRRYGSLVSRLFDLEHQVPEFAKCCVGYLGHMPGAGQAADDVADFHQDAPSDLAQLGQLIELERIVGQADMSMHVRLQTIWNLEKNTAPSVFGEEMWVSIAAMEQITGKAILQDAWMFARFTELLDSRVLSHITKERSTPHGRRFLNLNPVGVVGPNFQRMLDTLPMEQVRQMTVEIALPMWRSNLSVCRGIRARLDHYGISMALDGIPVSELAELSEEERTLVAFLKVNATPVADLEAGLAALPTGVAGRIILCRCETTDQIAAGIRHGIRYFQGYGLLKFLDRIEDVEAILGREAAGNVAGALVRGKPSRAVRRGRQNKSL